LTRWFRFYTGVVDDPKAQMLAPDMFKHWVNVLCIAAQHDGEMPAIAVTAFTLRMTEAKAAGILAKLHSLDLLDKTENGFKPHNWDGRQYKTDGTDNTNALRQKKHRDKQRDDLKQLKALRNASRNSLLRNGVSDVIAKRPDTETDNKTTTVSEVTGQRLCKDPTGKPSVSISSSLAANIARKLNA
jgi:hypothetical protein